MLNWLHRFMYGRHGSDQLSTAMAVAGIVLSLVNRFLRLGILDIISYLIVAAVIYRILSRDVIRRKGENQIFLNFCGSLATKMRLTRVRTFFNARTHQTKDYCCFYCPQCRQLVRVPRGKGRIMITCPSCKFKFKKKT